MTATADPSHSRSQNMDGSIKASLKVIEQLLDGAASSCCAVDRQFDAEFFESLGEELRRLHARMRVHHAVERLDEQKQAGNSPELVREVDRLEAEHSTIFGKLDRLVRQVDSMADRPLEDKEVFFLSGRELIALLRRHEAEEDRIFYLSVWRDLGGES